MNRLLVLVLLAFLVACGDNLAGPADAHGHGDTATPDSLVHRSRAIVVAPPINFGPPPGILSMLDVKTFVVTQNVVASVVGADPYLRSYDGKLFIVNRSDGNNVTILDQKTMMFEEQIGTGTSSNPQDVAVKGNKLYVPALGTAGVVVLTRGSTTIKTIDLSTAVGDPDGKPDCVSAYLVGNDLYVACDVLNNFVPRGPGKIAVIDTTTDTVRTTVTMPYPNPQNLFVRTQMDSTFGGDLLIPTLPSFSDLTQGCLVRVTVGPSPTASCAIPSDVLGGTVTHADVQTIGSIETLWMAVTTSFAPTANLRGFDLKSGTLWADPVSPAAQVITDVAVCPDGAVVVTDAKMNAAGFRVYRDAHETTTAPISIGLPPGFGNGLVCADQ